MSIHPLAVISSSCVACACLLGAEAIAFDFIFRQPKHPVLVVRQTNELGLTEQEKTDIEELLDYKREENSACYDEWRRVQRYPETEIRLTMAKWIEPRKQTRLELLQLARERIPNEKRSRYDELLFQFYIYAGEYYFASELIGRPLSAAQARELELLEDDDEHETRDVREHALLIEREMLENLGVHVDSGKPFHAMEDLRSTPTPPVTLKIDEYWAKLQHPAVIAELGLAKHQIERLRQIAVAHGLELREQMVTENRQLFQTQSQDVVSQRIAIGNRAMQEIRCPMPNGRDSSKSDINA